jgi:TIR domain
VGQATRYKVFISYSRKDKRWLDELHTQLRPYTRDCSIIAWSDKEIAPGSKWFEEIQSARSDATVAVLLVTPEFLASDFIHEHELGPFLKRAEQGGVQILWVHILACAYEKTALRLYNAVIDPKKPLANMQRAERAQAWVRICQEIGKAVGGGPSPIDDLPPFNIFDSSTLDGSAELAELWIRLLLADPDGEQQIKRIGYDVDKFLGRYTNDPEARELRDRVNTALTQMGCRFQLNRIARRLETDFAFKS